ncbi:hypothetical protein D9757_003979 [Collybiopsis confluens]|uniref:DNA ligase n=1 Tax=Collybiopsis confluens TaxID=2823264 RepID=A0A8H5MEG9_9AGAR|nr:hypothetical protein D9757_003979 [Collybiopsis confluens]
MVRETTAIEQKWIVRIIMKDMAISVRETTVFSVFHPDAQDLYNTTSDLRTVAWSLYDSERRINTMEKDLQLFKPFKPMLCTPLKSIKETVNEMKGQEFFIEEKLDGERMQVHVQGGKYFYCSRKGTDYTYLYGKNVNCGSLTAHLAKAFDERIESIILDGEMIAVDSETHQVLPFGSLKEAASGKMKNAQVCFKIFDILYLNGESLLNRTVKFRKRNMRAAIKEIKGRVGFVTEYMGRTAQEILRRLEEVLDAKGEGLVIKHPSSKYVLNDRNLDWVKIKPEHIDGMAESLDLLVVAGNYGRGKRGGKVSTLLCALKDDLGLNNSGSDRYRTFVRVGSGLTDVLLDRITDMPWKTRGSEGLPGWLQTLKVWGDNKYDVYLEPEEAFVLEVKASEIIASDHHHFDYSLRFPRAVRIRDDLGKDDCWTASRVMDYIRSEKKRKLDDGSKIGPAKKKPKKATKKIEVLPVYRNPNVGHIIPKKKRQPLKEPLNSDATDPDETLVAIELKDIADVKDFDDTERECEDDTTIYYDSDIIFKHLYLYLDSPANSERLGMAVKKKHEVEINESFVSLKKIISDNGGQIVDLDDPKLTHIVLDKRDTSRQVILRKRTSIPKHRRLVVSTFIDACLAEETLLNEEGAPASFV